MPSEDLLSEWNIKHEESESKLLVVGVLNGARRDRFEVVHAIPESGRCANETSGEKSLADVGVGSEDLVDAQLPVKGAHGRSISASVLHPTPTEILYAEQTHDVGGRKAASGAGARFGSARSRAPLDPGLTRWAATAPVL